MKTIIYVLALFLTVAVGNAQKSPNSNVSISYSNDEPGNKNYKVNIEISNNKGAYTLNASFPTSKTEKLKGFLKDHLDTKMTQNGSTYKWTYADKSEVGYIIKLKKGNLNVYMDKEHVSIDFVEDFIDMFSDLRDVLSE